MICIYFFHKPFTFKLHYVYIHTCIHIYMHTGTHAYMYACMHVCKCNETYMCI